MFYRQSEILNHQIVDSVPKLKRLAEKMMVLEEIALDTESNTLKVLGQNKDFSLVGISISWGEYNNYYIPVGHRRFEDYDRQIDLDTVVEYLKPVLEREDVRIIGWNIKFDMHVLMRVGIHIKTKDLFDGMVASWLCDENTPNGLKENSAHYLKVRQEKFNEVTDTVPKEVRKEFGLKGNSRVPFDLVLIDDGYEYALADAFYTWELYLGFMTLLENEKMHRIYDKVYRPFIHVLFDMEERGVTTDLDLLEKMSKEIKRDIETLEYQMFEIMGLEFNPSSSQQLAEILFGYRKQDKTNKNGKTVTAKVNEHLIDVSFHFKVISLTDGGAPQTNNDVLWRLSRMTFKNKYKQKGVELCKLLLEYKKLDKLNSAFIDGLRDKLYDDGKMHPSFNIIGTTSGRLSCSDPNLQQCPRVNEGDKYLIRSLFIGSEYCTDTDGNYLFDCDSSYNDNRCHQIKRKKIIALDYSNLEVRVATHFSQDDNLLKMFEEGKDVHGSTAVNMFELDCDPNDAKKLYPLLRQAAKTLNFINRVG